MTHLYCLTRITRFILLSGLTCWAALFAVSGYAAKVDLVELENGNVVTGEIKRLRQGKLEYGTDSMGTVQIEWDEIASLTGKARYRVETTSGNFLFGSIGPGSADGTMVVIDGDRETRLNIMDVFRITQINTEWREQLDQDLSVGYRYTKASEVEEFMLGYNATLITGRSRVDVGASGRTTDNGDDTTNQWLAETDFRRWLERRNYWLATVTGERNDELGIDLRLTAGAGFGRRFWQTTLSQFAAEAAPIVNYTEKSDGTSDTELEAQLRANWLVYIHDSPKRTLDTTLALVPGITEFGEYRSVFEITLRQELIKDLFWDLSFEHQYESEVSDENASNTDYAVKTALGFEF